MSNIDKIVEAIGTLDSENKDHFTKGGVPSVEALEAIAGIAEISAAERDEAWARYQEAHPAPEVTTSEADAKAKADAKVEADKVRAKADAEAKANAELQKAAEEATKGYFVKTGKSVTSLKGVKGPGDMVTAEIFGKTGTKVLEDLCKRGIVELRK